MKQSRKDILNRIKDRLRPTLPYRILFWAKYRMIRLLRGGKQLAKKLVAKCRPFAKRALVWLMETPLCAVVLTCKYGWHYHRFLRERRKMERPLVSIIVATYKPIPYLDKCIESALAQDRELADIEILICVNGQNRQYYEQLQKTYAHEDCIRVLYTETKGVGAGRNLGVRLARGSYLTFLDDDDYFTPHYVRDMMVYVREDTGIVCGRMVDVDDKAKRYTNATYINIALFRGAYNDYTRYNPSLFAVMGAKLYSKTLFDRFTPVDETLKNTEDIDFWAANIGNIQGKVAAVQHYSREAYVRRLTPNSMSRPDPESAYSFYVEDRIHMIERISARMFQELPLWQNRFLLTQIKSQYQFLLNYYRSLPEESEYRQKTRAAAAASVSPFINQSMLSSVKGVAFCHNFAPAVDASAYVAAKRLPAIAALHGEPIHWTVFSAKMQNRNTDQNYAAFYAQFQYAEQITVGSDSYFNESAQTDWGNAACKSAQTIDAAVMYSRSMWIGSHVAALAYRQQHPRTKWYAEFSDPLYMGTDNRPRPCAAGEDPNFWMNIEYDVMCQADVLIFTNENQLAYMLKMNPRIQHPETIREKSVVLRHPALPRQYASLLHCEYPMDTHMVHVGYFGTFYPNRNSDDLLRLLQRPDVAVHIFTPQKELELPKTYQPFAARLHLHDTVDHLSFLNVASRFDYLFLSDVDFPGEINPYLPSKFADYLMTGTPILAKVAANSCLSRMELPKFIRFETMDDALLQTLQKHSADAL